ncbi:MAG: Elongation factor Ts [Parcubacteria group bacterium GW2011_GWF2_44_8]|nr:MAG: Elongation factor Ts [Parcubacteria group bacterium GW2011_GWF2_44_8]
MSTQITAELVKKLREITGARIMDCKKALEEAKGDFAQAQKLVEAKGLARAEKNADREIKTGYIASYVHGNGLVASLVEILCETDFVGKNEEFRSLAKDIAMQVTAMNPATVEELLDQEFIKDGSKTIGVLLKSLSGKIGERMEIKRFVRYELGK